MSTFHWSGQWKMHMINYKYHYITLPLGSIHPPYLVQSIGDREGKRGELIENDKKWMGIPKETDLDSLEFRQPVCLVIVSIVAWQLDMY